MLIPRSDSSDGVFMWQQSALAACGTEAVDARSMRRHWDHKLKSSHNWAIRERLDAHSVQTVPARLLLGTIFFVMGVVSSAGVFVRAVFSNTGVFVLHG